MNIRSQWGSLAIPAPPLAPPPQADVNAKGGSRQRTPLHYASLNNHVAIATVLLQAGANEFARDSGGYTPLNLSMGGEMCKLLHKVEHHVIITRLSRDYHMTVVIIT